MREDYTRYSDEELLIRLRDGEPGITDHIMNKYKNLVRSKAKSMYILGADSEDLIQEGMIGLMCGVLLGAALLAPVFCPAFGLLRGLWYSLFHSVSAFCNAGFDLMGEGAPFSSLTGYAAHPLVNPVIMGLIITGGIGFATWDDIRTNRLKLRRYRMQSKVILSTTLLLILLPAACFFCAATICVATSPAETGLSNFAAFTICSKPASATPSMS